MGEDRVEKGCQVLQDLGVVVMKVDLDLEDMRSHWKVSEEES